MGISILDEAGSISTEPPGVHGRLRLQFEVAGNPKHTILRACDQELPLRVVRAFSLADGGKLVHLHNLSGGVLGGDCLELAIEVGPGAVAQVTSTGATRLYRSHLSTAAARQTTSIRVAENGLLEYLPDQLIPFTGSRYRQETDIELEAGAGLFWWETVAPGRAARGELFAYDMLNLRNTIRAEGQLRALEHIRLEPAQRSLSSLVRLGSFRYFSTFYICRAGIGSARWLELESRLEALVQQLSRPSQVIWGVSVLSADGLVVRALSVKGRYLQAGLPAFWSAAKRYLYDRDAVLPRKTN